MAALRRMELVSLAIAVGAQHRSVKENKLRGNRQMGPPGCAAKGGARCAPGRPWASRTSNFQEVAGDIIEERAAANPTRLDLPRSRRDRGAVGAQVAYAQEVAQIIEVAPKSRRNLACDQVPCYSARRDRLREAELDRTWMRRCYRRTVDATVLKLETAAPAAVTGTLARRRYTKSPPLLHP